MGIGSVFNMTKHYIYRHIREDKNEPFYIGIGTKKKEYNTYFDEYARAFQRSNRSKYWKNISSLTNISIEILLEDNDYEYIKQKEKEFITLYGRKDINTGFLINLTEGGDGSLGTICSVEKSKKLSEKRKLRKCTPKMLSGLEYGRFLKNKPRILIDTFTNEKINFNSSKELIKYLNINFLRINSYSKDKLYKKRYLIINGY